MMAAIATAGADGGTAAAIAEMRGGTRAASGDRGAHLDAPAQSAVPGHELGSPGAGSSPWRRVERQPLRARALSQSSVAASAG
jgi:hypothetical protein